ncbi:chemotaxis protein CheA [Marinobacter adhaerens]|uniref:chemotaxis protein CheA n=1 Tax=Marinobacter adhaerens TaxID=1033846 RepID=UPI001E4FD4A1|nr:chemotaxis protein CheA [Marinobacter adhaerens]MCD1646501.1 chemotaxis protein CheA [Marinobacter adhaerens]
MLTNDQWQQLLAGFLDESRELMQRCEDSLNELSEAPDSQEAINELFRAIHTVKGSAGLLGLDLLVHFVHDFENVLMAVRDGNQRLNEPLIDLCYRCCDQLSVLVDAVSEGQTSDPNPEKSARLLDALKQYLPEDDEALGRSLVANTTETLARDRDQDTWHISVRFGEDLFRDGFDPASFVRFLAQLGQITDISLIDSLIPSDLNQFDPESCYLGLEIRLYTDAGKKEIEDAFEFIHESTFLRILPPDSKTEDYLQLLAELPDTRGRLGEILVSVGAITESELQKALDLQSSSVSGKKLGECLVAQESASPQIVSEALKRQEKKKPTEPGAFLRVSARKLDDLINQVGELVIAAAGAQMIANRRKDPELTEVCEEIHQHIEHIRETSLQLRMVEMGEIFNRFHRVVRETADTLQKKIRLELEGADTELDKSLVDRLYDPLVHMVRNAMDHGLETPDERIAAGKPAEGRVRLSAYHESGMIVIEIDDDGRGINLEKVREKALAQGVITAEEDLDDKAIANLIFLPGLSTAKAVSNLSGRGVGMDSVRQDIEALRGSVDIDNRPGRGCCMRIRLPLTLAIIDGFLVSVSDQFFVIPTDWVTECIEAPKGLLQGQKSGYLELRGSALPFVSMKQHFSLPGNAPARNSLVVIAHGQERAGLLVDELHGEIQTVIKPLGPLFDHLPDIAGGTILGTGQVALTLDVPGLLTSVRAMEATTH